FRSTGDLKLEDLTFVNEDDRGDTYSVTLPGEDPTSDHYYFEGWIISTDGQLHPAGSSFTFHFDEIRSVTFTGEWTQVIGVGTYDLQGNTRYRLTSGSYQVSGDDTVYQGDQSFYLSSGGSLTVREG
ncbi:MAG: hypothetical protein IJ751_02440, partial [Oscillospiraceae bacterium]|nr:hypothetical protein [Oscillospiraceae bacterium]